MIGGGGFGQIFLAYDNSKMEHVAVKIEPPHTDARRMKLEQIVLVMLREVSTSRSETSLSDHFRPHIPTIMSSGKTKDGCPFIVMQLLGRNLSEMRRREKGRKLSPPTVYRAAKQALSGLQHLHSAGYLHRSVVVVEAPQNCEVLGT